jgi:hypothetical protein
VLVVIGVSLGCWFVWEIVIVSRACDTLRKVYLLYVLNNGEFEDG